MKNTELNNGASLFLTRGNPIPFLRGLSFLGIPLLLLFPFGASAQSILNAGGGGANLDGNVYSYSIGEMVLVGAVSSGNNTYTQGMLQASPDDMDVEKNDYLANGLKLYPNPVTNVAYLQPAFNAGGTLYLRLFDLNGRLIKSKKAMLPMGTERQQVAMSFLQEGTYLLQATFLQDDKTYRKTFKIIKIRK